jgi:hypothetical protein
MLQAKTTEFDRRSGTLNTQHYPYAMQLCDASPSACW